MEKIIVDSVKPKNFMAKVEVAACYLNVLEKLLFLKRATLIDETNLFGVPAGKIEPFESPEEAVRRELFEETKIQTPKPFRSLGALYMQKAHISYVYHLFELCLEDFPQVTLSKEHHSYCWKTAEEAKSLPLMLGAKEALEYYQRALT